MKAARVAGWLIVVCVLLLMPSVVIAEDYQNQLKAVAVNLVAKLEAANRHSGTVLDFTDLQGAPTELGRFLAQELTDQLVAAGKTVSFVDRANVQYLRRENNLSDEGFINPQTRQKYGNLVGIDTVILGTTTPIGQSIRLNLRAISIETGTIVATQATTLAALGEVGQLYTHGVASEPSSVQSEQPSVSKADSRSRFRADSIRLTGKEVVLTDSWNCGWNAGEVCASATLVLENLSGMGLDIAIIRHSTSIGSCTPTNGKISGLGSMEQQSLYTTNPDPYGSKPEWRYIPANGKLNLTISGLPCPMLSGSESVDVTTSLAIKIGDQSFSLPVSASGVPLRSGSAR